MEDLLNDLSMQPVPPVLDPGEEYAPASRQWQGIPGVERSPGGRLWATWYSGGPGEGPYNYVLLEASDDGGDTWSKPLLAIDPPEEVRAFDPCLWTDPMGRLWLFWAQSWKKFDGRCGVWAIRCDNPDADAPDWGEPRRLANGIMMNKPTVLSNGEWLMPAAIWKHHKIRWPQFEHERGPNVYVSSDEGDTWTWRGVADVPEPNCDEHMVVELKDGRLWMLVRVGFGIAQSFSEDGGRTWTPGEDSGIPGPRSRFFIRRLRSGRLLLVNHRGFTRDPEKGLKGRSHLTASLSEDDGKTWTRHLMIEERDRVSYPDGVEAADGNIHVIYDRERHGAAEILLARFTEENVLSQDPSGADVNPGKVVDCLNLPPKA